MNMGAGKDLKKDKQRRGGCVAEALLEGRGAKLNRRQRSQRQEIRWEATEKRGNGIHQNITVKGYLTYEAETYDEVTSDGIKIWKLLMESLNCRIMHFLQSVMRMIFALVNVCNYSN
jgi:hypothetical protein